MNLLFGVELFFEEYHHNAINRHISALKKDNNLVASGSKLKEESRFILDCEGSFG